LLIISHPTCLLNLVSRVSEGERSCTSGNFFVAGWREVFKACYHGIYRGTIRVTPYFLLPFMVPWELLAWE
jgi:hypothetical protein